jgi:DNA-binding NtrC family response regulator
MAIVILCVDDDRTLLQALRSMLSSTLGRDCRIEIAESGDEALELLDEVAGDGDQVGVVFADYIMPRMRGDELLVKLHGRDPAMVKIMLTGQSDFSGVKRVINEANLYRFIEKPFVNADLVLTARSALQTRQRETALHAEITALRQRVAALERNAPGAA